MNDPIGLLCGVLLAVLIGGSALRMFLDAIDSERPTATRRRDERGRFVRKEASK